MTFYGCTARGVCEEQDSGRFTAQQCQERCHPLIDESDEAYQIYLETLMLDLELAEQAPYSEQQAIIRRITGVTVPIDQVFSILTPLFFRNYAALWLAPELRDWCQQQIDWDPLYQWFVEILEDSDVALEPFNWPNIFARVRFGMKAYGREFNPLNQEREIRRRALQAFVEFYTDGQGKNIRPISDRHLEWFSERIGLPSLID